jgi:hypothetical protein
MLVMQLLLFVPVTSASDIPEHAFNAQLSLTGGSGTSKVDPVPDPGKTHPVEPFKLPEGVAVDTQGDVYVVNKGKFDVENFNWDKGSIDIFDRAGNFITEIANEEGPESIAVDSIGNIYVVQTDTTSVPNQKGVVRYAPSEYPPTPATIYSGPVMVTSSPAPAIAVSRSSKHHDHLLAIEAGDVNEYGSATEGNPLLRGNIDGGTLHSPNSLAVNAATGEIFIGAVCPECPPAPNAEHPHVSVVEVLDEEGNRIGEIKGSEMPAGGFKTSSGFLPVELDEAAGELFVDDVRASKHVYRFVRDEAKGPEEEAGYRYVPDPELEDGAYLDPSWIAVANGPSPNQHDVYVSSNNPEPHLFAFTRLVIGPPEIRAANAAEISVTEAHLEAEVNPGGAEANGRFEYVSEATYGKDVEELGPGHGFDHAAATPEAALGAGGQWVGLSASVEGLEPGSTYRARAVAVNHCHPSEPEVECRAEEEFRFGTYPEEAVPGCSDEAVRSGLSRLLPDCRAYELVTPPDTNGRAPMGAGISLGPGSFDTQLSSPSGDSLLFSSIGGGLPGSEGNGIIDPYEARRTASGWSTADAGFGGGQSQNPTAGGVSPDHGYWFLSTGGGQDHGSLVINDEPTDYLRLPDRTSALLGQGPLGTDPKAEGQWIAPGGSHVIFTSKVPLASGTSPAGVLTVYDRASDGSLSVLSLKPGEAPGAGAKVEYLGASADGTAVAYAVTEAGITTLYEKREGAAAAAVAQGTTTFAGLSESGSRLTYVKGGDIYSFDAQTDASTQLGSGGESVTVNVSADGSRVYFASPAVLAAGAGGGKDNLYLWEAGSEEIVFIAVLEPGDLTGEDGTYGLGFWSAVVGQGSADDPSRTTPDGEVIVFESRADLTGYESGGDSEIYRYEAVSHRLTCISCNPTLAAPSGSAHLQITPRGNSDFNQLAPLGDGTPVPALADEGQMVFFQTPDPLVARDVDKSDDVYEWEANGIGGCTRDVGCLHLISSGHTNGPNYIFAATPSGSDVFFTTPDLLTASDGDVTRSVYDARIGGGFAEAAPVPCSGESCKGQPTPPPAVPSIASQVPPSHRSHSCSHRRRAGASARARRCHRHRSHHRHRKGGGR